MDYIVLLLIAAALVLTCSERVWTRLYQAWDSFLERAWRS